jgi:abequosyltransferase
MAAGGLFERSFRSDQINLVKLSVCISTINRADFIGQTLQSIIPQMTDDVELIVVDSSSDSSTEDIVREFEGRGNLVYLRRKLSFGEAYSKAVDMATGEYCWLFTDDDLIKPGAISAVLEAIQRPFSLIIVNAEVRTKDLSSCLEERRVPVFEDRTYSTKSTEQNNLLAETGMYLTFIGAVIIRRDLWQERIKEEYFESLFIHMIVMFERRLPNDTLFIAHPWIVIRWGNALWRSKSFEIWMFEFPELIWSFNDFADWAKQRVERREPWRRWRRLVMLRAMGRYSTDQYRAWLETRLKILPERILARAIAFAPIAPLNLLAQIFLIATGKARNLAMIDLKMWRAQASAG